MPESALCELARARGATCIEVGGFSVPAAFGDPAAEWRALCEDAALVDLAFRERVRVGGADRVDFLQGMLSNDVRTLAPGRGCPALLLSDQGKVVGDLVVVPLADAVLLDGMATAVAAVVAALERYVVADDVEVAALGGADHAIGLYGPQAAATLARLGPGAPPGDPYGFATLDLAGSAVLTQRVPVPAPGGFLCYVPAAAAPAWWTRCLDAGVRPAGQRAFDVLRIEGGVPWHGRDVSAETLALEAPLEHAISFTKGCYLGQEVVERVSARGHVNRRLMGLEIAGETAPEAGDRLFAGAREIGWVTSVAWSWRLSCTVALGYVRREYWAPGTALEVAARAGRLPVTVRALPFA